MHNVARVQRALVAILPSIRFRQPERLPEPKTSFKGSSMAAVEEELKSIVLLLCWVFR